MSWESDTIDVPHACAASLTNINDEYLLFVGGSEATFKLDLESRVWTKVVTTGFFHKELGVFLLVFPIFK
jgi:hypothetical protein